MAEMGPIDERDTAFEALYREVRERATELGEKRGMTEELLQNVLENVTEPGRFADLVAGYIDLPVPERQSLLETLAVEERLRRVLVHVQREIGMLDAQAEIKTQVQEELGERQREMYLREQLKAIQKELGDEDEPSRELAELREKIAKLDLPKEVRAEVERELGRLGRSGRESMDAQVIRTYLEWIAELPWNARSDDDLDLKKAIGVLDQDHYGLKDVKDRVLEFLAVRQLRARELERQVREDGRGPGRRAQGRGGRSSRASGPRRGRSPTPGRRRHGRWPRGRSSSSSALRGWARPRSPRASPGPWGGNMSASRSAGCATRPTSAGIAGPTSAPCPAGSSRG